MVLTARLPLAADQPARLTKIELAVSAERDIVVTRLDDNSYQAVAIDRPLTRSLTFAKGTIESSLYVAAVRAKVPLSVLAELIQIFSFDVDFQRDFRRGDGFSLIYARYRDEAGLKVRNGEIEVAAIGNWKTLAVLHRRYSRIKPVQLLQKINNVVNLK